MYIPCYSAGVVEGRVVKVTDGEKEPQASVKVHIEKKGGSYKQVIPVFSDGTFYQVGVPPGEYTAWVDSAQCEILNVEQQPPQVAFNVKKTVDGDFVDGVELELYSQEAHLAKANGKKKMSTDIAMEEEQLRHPKEEAGTEIKEESKVVADEGASTEKAKETVADVTGSSKVSSTEIVINENKLFSYSGVRDVSLTKEMEKYLDVVANYMKKNLRAVVSIVGHTDNFGTLDETQSLSEQRAQEAVRYLIGKGIGRERILPRGEGSRTPIVSNTTPSGRKQNRRLEVTIIE
jgi:outer membrane protein OmpA-like peptidoglycan-associated protein